MIKDWNKIGIELEDYYSLFYSFWGVGVPSLVTDIPTAAVSFDKEGEFIRFLYNDKFWNECSFYERLFIVSHEMMHIILNHGYRSSGMEPNISNIAADIVVNEMLARVYGFERDKISFADDLCWLDTIFPAGDQSYGHNFEYYYNVLLQDAVTIDVTGIMFIDDISKLGQGSDLSKFVEELAKSGGYDAEKLENEINETKEMDGDKTTVSVGAKAGTGGGSWGSYELENVKENKKWVKLFKKFFKTFAEDDNEQWAYPNRRFTELPNDLILPSEHEQDNREKNKISIWLFLDVSGSCGSLRKTFLKVYQTIPKKIFDVRLFSFDTKVYPVDMVKRKIYGGGGTSFGPIESSIQRTMKQEKCEYPKIVVIFTDGEGSTVRPQYPERWHWFLINSYGYGRNNLYTAYVPKESTVYSFVDYM